jgi:hypothetical protein
MSPRRHHLDDQLAQLRRVAEDDALLDALARRDHVTPSGSASADRDDVTTLLRALTVDVDTHVERAVSRPAAPAVSLLPPKQRPRPTRVRRSAAALGLLGAIVAGGTGVAAAVTGDPFAGFDGLQRVIQAATSGVKEVPPKAPRAPSSTPPVHGSLPAGSPAAVPSGGLTFAPAPTGTPGAASEHQVAPGAGPATTPPPTAGSDREPATARGQSHSVNGNQHSVSGKQHSRSADEPGPTTPGQPPSPAEREQPSKPSPGEGALRPAPSDEPSVTVQVHPTHPVAPPRRGAADHGVKPDPGQKGVSASSHRGSVPGSVPAPAPVTSPEPPPDGD